MESATVNRASLALGVLSIAVLGGLGTIAGGQPSVWILNLGIVFLAAALGVLMGFLVSPYVEEQKNFSTYAKYLLALVTGYLASKLDRAIDAAVAASTSQPIVAFRILVFFSVFVISVIVTFVARRYPL